METTYNPTVKLPSKETLEKDISLLLNCLTKIDDASGEYLLDFDGLKVDDKSWCVWNWPQGIGLFGTYMNYRITGNEKARRIVTDWFEARMQEGAPNKNINTMTPLLAMACLYEDTGDSRYVPYLERWAEWAMNDLTRTEERGFQHVTYGPAHTQQLWDDTLMMTVLPLAKIGMLLGRDDYVEEARYQLMVHIKYLADRKTGLWFHGWSFERRDNFAGALWCRGNCWITISFPLFIEVLGLKEGDALYELLVQTLKALIKALAEYQDESGLWHTLINDPGSYLETSGTAGIAFGILRAVHKRYVDPSYEDVANKAINGVLSQMGDHGQLKNVSVGTGLEDNLDYYRNIATTDMPYGQSLSVLALTEALVSYC